MKAQNYSSIKSPKFPQRLPQLQIQISFSLLFSLSQSFSSSNGDLSHHPNQNPIRKIPSQKAPQPEPDTDHGGLILVVQVPIRGLQSASGLRGSIRREAPDSRDRRPRWTVRWQELPPRSPPGFPIQYPGGRDGHSSPPHSPDGSRPHRSRASLPISGTALALSAFWVLVLIFRKSSLLSQLSKKMSLYIH